MVHTQVFTPYLFEDIGQASISAIKVARSIEAPVSMIFNGLHVRVHPTSEPKDIVEKYHYQSELRRLTANL